MIALTPVLRSGNIAACAYDPVAHIVAVEFSGGAVWHYKHVPPEVGEVMMQVVQQANAAHESGMAHDSAETPSVGRYFAAMVRGKYDGEKIISE
jgi:hypothetical protein